MRIWLSMAVALCMESANAYAAVSVSEQVMQQGQFVKADCEADAKDPDYNACICDADIRYPQLTGMGDHGMEDKLNGWFKEEASKSTCEGDKTPLAEGNAKPPADGAAHASLSVHYEQTFSSPGVLAFKFTDWAYTGGAHGNGSVIGIILDLKKGKFLTPTDIFSTANMPAVNKTIYDVLTAKPEEEIFRDQIESRQGLFIKDGDCMGCTLTLTPEGVHVLFQTYEVAPYGAGNTDVPIPTQLVGNKAVADALTESQNPAPEKK